MANIDLSTIGMRLGYAFETSKGVRPTTGYTNIARPKSLPDANPEPNTGETTSLNNEEYTSYIPLLKDLGGSLGIDMGMSEDGLHNWNDMCETAEEKKALGFRTWFVFYHPQLDVSFFIPADPTPLGFVEAGVNEVWDGTVYITPVDEPTWETAVKPVDPASA